MGLRPQTPVIGSHTALAMGPSPQKKQFRLEPPLLPRILRSKVYWCSSIGVTIVRLRLTALHVLHKRHKRSFRDKK